MGMGWGGVGWGCSRSCTYSVHIKLLQRQNLWGCSWGGVHVALTSSCCNRRIYGDGVGWYGGGDVHVHVDVAFASSCCSRRIDEDGVGVGWGGDVHVHVHVAFTSSCCNRRIYGDGEGWGACSPWGNRSALMYMFRSVHIQVCCSRRIYWGLVVGWGGSMFTLSCTHVAFTS